MTNGWSEYQKTVMHQLEELDADIKALDEKVTLLRIDVAQLKIKAGIWGAVAGMIPGIISAVLLFSGQAG